MKYLFIDESGDHNLLPDKIDPSFPLFVLTGIIIEKSEHQKVHNAMLKLKKKIFNNEKVILHSLELTRTNQAKQKSFRILANKAIRANFYLELNKLLKASNFSIAFFVINKPWYAKQFPISPPDPYFLSFSSILDYFNQHLGNREKGEIYAEQRNKILDKQFLLAWESSTVRIGLVTRKQLENHKLSKPNIVKKSGKFTGLEIADLVSYRLSRHVMGKTSKAAGNEIDIKIIASKKINASGLPNVQNMH
ncbi:MAG: hypothetical protein US51_C0049G0004 [Microgenomates group bacterium GW2011_GWA2_37_6]|nr:MAG: hypothetical protein US51_C0049G0004 [Microgenomates group bacterium GW2011_GWA2_37_6]